MSISAAFKEVMSSWATGVAVMAARAGDLVHGVTVSSFTSLSLDPPLVLVCLHEHSSLLQLVDQARRFSVSVLSEQQGPISVYFATRGREPQPALPELEDAEAAGLPVVKEAAAWLGCDLHAKFMQGDHVIVVGRVTEGCTADARRPLLYHRRGYHALGGRL